MAPNGAAKTCVIKIEDQVNCKLEGLDPFLRRKIVESLKLFVPHARHMPSFKLGRWDGKVSFATAGGGTYINLLDKVLPLVMDEGYTVDLDDKRPDYAFEWPPIDESYPSDRCWPVGHERAGEPITLRDYQVEAIQNFVDNPQSLQCISTGAGKTLLTACLSRLVEPYGRSIVVVPSKSLVVQTEADYRAMGLDVGVYYGERKEWNRTHTICTWQSLTALSKRTINEQAAEGASFLDLVHGLAAIIVDEAHTIKGTELRDLLCGPLAGVPIRWGLTGTIPKEAWEFWNLLAAIGPVVGEVRAADLQERGVLANCNIEIVVTEDDHVEFKRYPDEYDYLVTDKDRLAWLAEYCAKVALDGNTLILVDRIETGDKLASMLPGSVFIHGGVANKKRASHWRDVASEDDKIIVATYGVAAVGINAPRLFNVIMIEPGKSFVRVIQTIGRGLRKAHDKDEVNIKDVCSSLKFSSRHRSKRAGYYRDAGYPYKNTKTVWRLA